MNITLIGFLLGMLLLVLPLVAMYRYGLRISVGRALSAIFRMVIYVGIMGFVMYMLQKDGSVAMSLLFALVLIVLAAVAYSARVLACVCCSFRSWRLWLCRSLWCRRGFCL